MAGFYWLGEHHVILNLLPDWLVWGEVRVKWFLCVLERVNGGECSVRPVIKCSK